MTGGDWRTGLAGGMLLWGLGLGRWKFFGKSVEMHPADRSRRAVADDDGIKMGLPARHPRGVTLHWLFAKRGMFSIDGDGRCEHLPYTNDKKRPTKTAKQQELW